MIRLVEPEELILKWYILKPMVQKSLDHGMDESSTHDLFMECMHMNAQCWVIEDSEGYIKGVGITRIIQQSQYKQLQVVTLTGKRMLKEIEECCKTVEMFAKGTGCKNISIYGRPGWERVLPDGYKKTYTVYHKEV